MKVSILVEQIYAHPFEDGNGRIGRALSEKILIYHSNSFFPISLSKAIESKKKMYYAQLEQAQKTLDMTQWITYFVDVVLLAFEQTEEWTEFVIKKANFYDTYGSSLNVRQNKVIRRMLDEGPKGFEGGINAKKYISITGCSKATATRDLQSLLAMGVLKHLSGAARGIRYQIVL